MQQEMNTFRRPAHWLMVAHPLIDQMAHCGFGWNARDPQLVAAVTSVAIAAGSSTVAPASRLPFGHLFSMRITSRAFAVPIIGIKREFFA
ncbi:hypothetical protein [Edaphobacter aggregans]|uniref:hypothetical protein n=1 Tax=Edaphobacter aggregans TaxID=570835 RepID=UPI000F735563|nr:hypothetical protein [Edaphobacter aggregans]